MLVFNHLSQTMVPRFPLRWVGGKRWPIVCAFSDDWSICSLLDRAIAGVAWLILRFYTDIVGSCNEPRRRVLICITKPIPATGLWSSIIMWMCWGQRNHEDKKFLPVRHLVGDTAEQIKKVKGGKNVDEWGSSISFRRSIKTWKNRRFIGIVLHCTMPRELFPPSLFVINMFPQASYLSASIIAESAASRTLAPWSTFSMLLVF